MAELAPPHPQAVAGRKLPTGAIFGEDCPWLTVMAAVTAIELAWWTVTWKLGLAPGPFLLTYLVLASAGLTCAFLLRKLLQPQAASSNWSSTIPGTILVGIGASLFLPLKYAIPSLVPFWLDPPLAKTERAIFAGDPWVILDHLLGWAAVPIDRLYAIWLPTQSILLFTVMMQPPSTKKSRALIAYVLAWFLLGVVAATALSSAGPIFYDRIFGGTAFAALRETLQARGAWLALAESDSMWTSLVSIRPGLAAGISAVPSIHVAICVWLFLAARTMAPRAAPYAFIYVVLVWIGSVQLGWHYVTDGLVGVLGMLAIWVLSGMLQRHLEA
ncbi:MAG: phosphatase PAP2 family protein, partial [Sphingomicrobium sp.]